MAEDQSSDGPGAGDLPEPIREWLADRAAEEGIPEEELVSRLLRAGGAADGDTTGERLDAVEETVEALRVDLDEKIDDVRGRVIQVKREVDDRAPADHDHPELEERIERTADGAGAEASVPGHGAGEGNGIVETLEHLVETTGELEHKLDRLARVTVSLRGIVDDLAGSEAENAAVAALARSANVHGARRADCGSCGESVDVGLLSKPRCPYCAEPFEAFVPNHGLFGSHTLEVGSPPALEPADGLESVPDPDIGTDDGGDGPLSGVDFGDVGAAGGTEDDGTPGGSGEAEAGSAIRWPGDDEEGISADGDGPDAGPEDGEANEGADPPRSPDE